MISSKIYQLDTSSIQWDVAHIYEHLLIYEFKKYLLYHGVNPDLFGWISGETFENRIFIEAAFYNSEYSRLLNSFMNDLPSFSERSIKTATESVEVEEKGHFIGSTSDLMSDIEKLKNISFNLNSTSGSSTPFKSLIRKSTRDFRDITISIESSELTFDEQKIFLRLRPILSDIINNYLLTNNIIYSRDVSPVHRDGDKERLKFIAIITARNISGSLSGLANNIRHYIENYPIGQHWNDFHSHFSGFASEQLWKNSSIEYYRYTGIITNPEEILRLATIERIENILSKIEIKMRSTRTEDIDLINI